MTKRNIRTALLALLLWGQASFADEQITPSDVSLPMRWGGVGNVTNLRHLYFAGQPDGAALDAAESAGVKIVINLRGSNEIDWDEKAAVEERGMEYYNVPVTGQAFDPSAFAQIENILEQNASVPTLLHCGSSNRVGGWLATHLVTKHGLLEEQAITIGRLAGITHQGIVTNVKSYLQNAQ